MNLEYFSVYQTPSSLYILRENLDKNHVKHPIFQLYVSICIIIDVLSGRASVINVNCIYGQQYILQLTKKYISKFNETWKMLWVDNNN